MRQRKNPVKVDPHHDGSLFVRMGSAIRMTGLCRSRIYRLVAQDTFPSPVRWLNTRVKFGSARSL